MSAFLEILSGEVGPSDHVVLILDQAGWHKSKNLKVPANITLQHLPPYSPELNPVENLWHHLKSHDLSNRAFDNYDTPLEAGGQAWRAPTKDQLKSICAAPWFTPGNQL